MMSEIKLHPECARDHRNADIEKEKKGRRVRDNASNGRVFSYLKTSAGRVALLLLGAIDRGLSARALSARRLSLTTRHCLIKMGRGNDGEKRWVCGLRRLQKRCQIDGR